MSRIPQVLIVEDNEISRTITSELLTRAGFRTVVARHGLEAIDVLRLRPVDVVLMDCQMPTMDGYEATTIIRDDELRGRIKWLPAGTRLPILGLLTEPPTDDSPRERACGMDGVLNKPLDPDELVQLIQEVLSPDGSRAGAPPINVSALMDRCMGEPKFVESLLMKFEIQAEQCTKELQKAMATNDGAALQATAAAIKDAALSLSADPLNHLAARVEQIGRDGMTTCTPAALKALESEIARCLDFVPRVLGTSRAKL